jgi:hypothetical protein
MTLVKPFAILVDGWGEGGTQIAKIAGIAKIENKKHNPHH